MKLAGKELCLAWSELLGKAEREERHKWRISVLIRSVFNRNVYSERTTWCIFSEAK